MQIPFYSVKFDTELNIGDEVYVIPMDQCGFVQNIRVDTSGHPIITVKLLNNNNDYSYYVTRYEELRQVLNRF